jgi:hypothetical protein
MQWLVILLMLENRELLRFDGDPSLFITLSAVKR